MSDKKDVTWLGEVPQTIKIFLQIPPYHTSTVILNKLECPTYPRVVLAVVLKLLLKIFFVFSHNFQGNRDFRLRDFFSPIGSQIQSF